MHFRLWHAFCPTIFSGNSIMRFVLGWVRAESMLLMAILCIGAPAAVFGQGPTIYGQVILEDGTPVRESIRVDLECSGQPIRHSFTRVEGSFSFELGSAARSADASIATMSRPGFAGSRSFDTRHGKSSLTSIFGHQPLLVKSK